MERTKRKLYQEFAARVQAVELCAVSGNREWQDNHEQWLKDACKNLMPSGSGIDNGVLLDLDASGPQRLTFTFGYHHMDEMGGYDGWTEHRMVVKADMVSGFELRIYGPNKNDVKEYLYQLMDYALRTEVEIE